MPPDRQGPDTDIAARKSALRTLLKARRSTAHADPARRAALSQALVAALPAFARGRCLAGYMPLPSEADPRAAMEAHTGPLCLPVVVAPAAALAFVGWRPGQDLRRGAFGIAEPATGTACRPEVLIVPVLGFDAAGRRLGYGGGYYDRTLAALRRDGAGPVLALGLAYDAQECPSLPTEATDARLDAIVTEAGLRWVSSAAD